MLSPAVHTDDLRMATLVVSCQMGGVTGSVGGLDGPVSVCCDWGR